MTKTKPKTEPVKENVNNVHFTKTEAEALIQLLDIAVKSEGLLFAENAIHIKRKLDAAFLPIQ